MANPLPIPMPLKGLNTLNPFVPWDSGYARDIANYAIWSGSLISRPSVKTKIAANAAVTKLNWYSSDGVTGIEKSGGDIVTISTGATIGNIGGNCQAEATQVKHISLDLVIGCREPRASAPPFTAWSFTTLTITATAITSACSHKGRLYVCDGSTIEYSEITAVAGTMKGKFTISALMGGQSVIRMFSVTVQPGNEADNVFVIFGSGGKVLVYSGYYPGDSGWQIIGNYDMPKPASNVSFCETDGDIFVISSQYAYWCRDLFSDGAQTAFAKSPTAAIQNLWKYFDWGQVATIVPYAFYYAPYECIVCCPPPDNGLLAYSPYSFTPVLVYFKNYQAWALWWIPPFAWPIRIDATRPIGNSYPYANLNTPNILEMTERSMTDILTVSGVSTEYDFITSYKTPYSLFEGNSKLLQGVMTFYRTNKILTNDVSDGDFLSVNAMFDMSDYLIPFGFGAVNASGIPFPGIQTTGSIHSPVNSTGIYGEYCGVAGAGYAFSIQFRQQLVGDYNSAIEQTQQIYQASAYFDNGAPYPA